MEVSQTCLYKHFIAGALAGGIARTATAPLDRIKTMSQIAGKTIPPIKGIKMMLEEGGFFSMWRGNGANCLGVVPEVAIKFSLYQHLKKRVFEKRRSENLPVGTLDRATAAALSGTLSHIIIHPLSVIKTRLVIRKTGEPKGLSNTIQRGYKLHGWKFFYKGFFTTVSGIFVFSAIDLTTYEYLKGVNTKKHEHINVWVIMTCGLISSFSALIVVYPVFLLSTYLQASDEQFRIKAYANKIKRKGWTRLYSGLPAALMKGLPSMVIAYIVYEAVLEALGEEMI